ncbi:MAG: hypothetical protein JF571_08180 [Asticcacaulis sp.]|nr:hypothetical protein [Asticcacaulis sp.]
MPDFILLTASIVMAAAFFVHVFIGGKYVARPLLADRRLPPASKWLNYYCWHLVSLMLAFFSLFLAYSGFNRPNIFILGGLVAFFAGCGGLSVYAANKGGISPLRFPSTTLFFVCAVCVAADVLTYG